MLPALATPLGGLFAGFLMQRRYPLCLNVRLGTATMLLGNLLAITMGTDGCRWKEFFYLIPANLGLGLTNPSVLFSFVSLTEHQGKSRRVARPKGHGLTSHRTSGCHVDCVFDPVHGHDLRCYRDVGHRAECVVDEAARGVGRGGDRRGVWARESSRFEGCCRC